MITQEQVKIEQLDLANKHRVWVDINNNDDLIAFKFDHIPTLYEINQVVDNYLIIINKVIE